MTIRKIQARPDFSLEIRRNAADEWGFSGICGSSTTLPSRPLDALIATEVDDTANGATLAGSGDSFQWRTKITPQAGGFLLETTLQVSQPMTLDPTMILWLGTLDNMDDRQAHTWRQAILRAPTTNQQGLGGNDLPACYLYDPTTHIETICYFPPDRFAWATHRFYDFTMREVTVYRPERRYGIGLIPNAPTTPFAFDVGEHQFAWWFTQRHRDQPPTIWQAQQALIEAVAPLLDPIPTPIPDAPAWQVMAQRALDDLQSTDCWVTVDGQTGLRAYVRGSSALKRDEPRSFELMTQIDVLYPLLMWRSATQSDAANQVIDQLLQTIPLFDRPEWDFVANGFPRRAGGADGFMDTWYFLENGLIKLAWVAYLTGDDALKGMFFQALKGARTMAHKANYLFPLFADASDWSARNSLLNVGVGGMYALGCVLADQLKDEADSTDYLSEAAAALLTMHRLNPTQLTHEPQQLTFAAAAANYLAAHGDSSEDWQGIARDFIYTVLRMGYWGADAAVDFYDPRGMFQACASLCYPAYKENVETILPFAEIIAGQGDFPDDLTKLLATFVNLQRRHNYAFFDPFVPEALRRGSCAYIPYEDLETAEFTHTAKLGKELYGAGEVFWSALLFDALAQVDDPDVLCLCLDVPCAELRPIPSERRCLLYNPTVDTRTVTTSDGQTIDLSPGVRYVVITTSL